MIPTYPESCEITLALRPLLHPLFQTLPEGISEFTFAGLYLFRQKHRYRIARLPDGRVVVTGEDTASPLPGRMGDDLACRAGADAGPVAGPFFMLPFGVPAPEILDDLFAGFGRMKAVSESLAADLAGRNYRVEEDRDSFDYLYRRTDMAELPGRRFHKKKNLVNAFRRQHRAEGRPLLEEYMPEALHVLEAWRAERLAADVGEHAPKDDAGAEGGGAGGDSAEGDYADGDYSAAREALERMEELQLCGGIYYVEGRPVAYTLGEEIARGRTFAIHFEKALRTAQYRGIYQFMNHVFASILPEKYETINREQDLGDPGLRQAKESYNPAGFVKKFRAWKP